MEMDEMMDEVLNVVTVKLWLFACVCELCGSTWRLSAPLLSFSIHPAPGVLGA